MRGFFLAVALLVSTCASDCKAQAGTAELSQLISRAHAEQVQGDLDGAARDYTRAISMQPQAIEWKINLGLVQYERKEYVKSAEILEPVALRHRDEFVSHLFAGLDHLALHQPAKAIGFLETAEALRPADPQVPVALARSYAGAKQYDKSLLAYRRAWKLSPSDGDVLFETGMSYLGEVEERSRQLLETSSPNSSLVRILLGDALMDQHRFTEALKTYGEAEGKGSMVENECLDARRAFALFGSGETSSARRLWQTDVDSKTSCSLSSLGLIAAATADEGVAAQIDRLKNSNGKPATFSIMDEAWAVRVLSKEAAARLTDSLERAGLGPVETTALKISQIYPSESPTGGSSQGCTTTARPVGTHLPAARAVEPVVARVNDGKIADAAQCANMGLQVNRNEPELLFWSIRVNELLASQALELFRASAPDAPRTHLLLGDMDRQRGDLEAAEKEYQTVLTAEPHNLVAAVGLAIAYLRDGKTDESVERARAVLAEDSSSEAANQILGEALIEKRQFVEAEAPLRDALSSGSDNPAHLHALLGRAEAGLGHTAIAIKELELGAPSDVDGSLYFQLSRLYRQVGNEQGAVKAIATSKMLVRRRMDSSLLETADHTSARVNGQP